MGDGWKGNYAVEMGDWTVKERSRQTGETAKPEAGNWTVKEKTVFFPFPS
jgi:hypothetical protein